MRERISALMDDELSGEELDRALAALRASDEGRDAWHTYHLIGDALRDTRWLSPGFARRVAERISQEPQIVAPNALLTRPRSARARRLGLRLVAGAAAATFVGWVAFAPRPASEQAAPVATAPVATPAIAQTEPARVPPPAAAHDYLLAHQRYVPGIALPGVAPYARTVSVETTGGRRP